MSNTKTVHFTSLLPSISDAYERKLDISLEVTGCQRNCFLGTLTIKESPVNFHMELAEVNDVTDKMEVSNLDKLQYAYFVRDLLLGLGIKYIASTIPEIRQTLTPISADNKLINNFSPVINVEDSTDLDINNIELKIKFLNRLFKPLSIYINHSIHRITLQREGIDLKKAAEKCKIPVAPFIFDETLPHNTEILVVTYIIINQ